MAATKPPLMIMSPPTESSSLALTAPLGSVSSVSLLMDTASLDRMERFADLMASGKTTIPQHLRGSKGDCFAIAMQSMQWGMNPFAVAQKTHLVNGVLGYEAQLVAAVINNSGVVTDRFRFEWFGPWEKVIGKYQIKRGDKGEYRVPGWSMADEEGCGIRVFATLRGESEPRVLQLLLAQARVRNSTLWADDPKQQLAYLAQKRWARLFAPDVILGVYSPEELEAAPEVHMGAAEVVGRAAAPAPASARPQLEPYPETNFYENLPKWRRYVEAGKATPDSLLTTLRTVATVSAEQERRIRELQPVEAPEPPPPHQEGVDPDTGEVPPPADQHADWIDDMDAAQRGKE